MVLSDGPFSQVLYDILTEVAFGFSEKADLYNAQENAVVKRKYIREDHLTRALNRLGALAWKYQLRAPDGRLAVPENETDAALHYFPRSSTEWTADWPEPLRLEIERDPGEIDPLILLYSGEQKFMMTAEGREWAGECAAWNQDTEQRRVFQLFLKLSQEGYVFARDFLIRHPVIAPDAHREFLRGMILSGADEPLADQIARSAYEPVPEDTVFRCPYCGWTVSRRRDGSLHCIHPRCLQHIHEAQEENLGWTPLTLLRLKPGVMRYIAFPGKLEQRIAELCERLGVTSERWPDQDSCDLRLTLAHQGVWEIDAKDYGNAYLLRHTIRTKAPFSPDGWNRAFLVVPDEAVAARADYCDIVNASWAEKNRRGCVRFSDFARMLREAVR